MAKGKKHHGNNKSGTGAYQSFACPDGHVHVVMTLPGYKEPFELIFEADDAYDFGETIKLAYDDAVGIGRS